MTNLKSNGSIERLKARLVAQGYPHISGIDFDEAFTPVIKPSIFGVILSSSVTSNQKVH